MSPTSSNYTALSLLFVVSYVFLFRHSLLGPGTTELTASSALLRRVLTVLVVVHTVYMLRLLLSPPVNLFTLLNLPLTVPVSAIRVALLERQKDAFPVGFQNKIAQDVETLISRLSSFEARVVYVKYGPYALSHCVPCVHLSDFAIFSLAPTVLPYLRTLILTSLITSYPAQRPAWRTPALVVLAAAFFAEVWWTVDGEVVFRDGRLDGWTHTHTYLARTALLLLLPLLTHHLPAHSCLSPLPPFIALPARPRPSFPHQSSDFHLTNPNGTPQTQMPQRPNAATASGIPRPVSTPVSNSYPVPGPSTSIPNPPNSIPTTLPNFNLNANNNVPPSPFSTLNSTLSSLSTTLGTLRVLEWAHLAGMRRGEVREKMEEYYATANRNAAYARGDAALHREAEKLGMGYREGHSMEEREGGLARRSWAGKKGATWRGGDPRGLDEDSVLEGIDERDGRRSSAGNGWRSEAWQRQRERERDERGEEDEMLANSPLRARARKAANEISQIYLKGTGRREAGTGVGSGLGEG